MKLTFGKSYILIFIIFFFMGCAKPTPISFDDTSETLLVYPLFDSRTNPNENITSMNHLFEDIDEKYLFTHPVNSYYMGRYFNCKVSYAYDLGIMPNVSYADLKEENIKRLMTLNTNGENYVLIIFLSELNQDAVLTSVASLEAFLVQVKTGRIIWSNSENTTVYQGLLERALGGKVLDAYDYTINKILISFPVLMKES